MPDDMSSLEAVLSASPSPEASPSPPPMPPGASRLKGFPFHPLFIAAFPVLSLYAHNMDEASLQDFLQPLCFALLSVLGVWALLALLTRHIRKAACAASALILLFFSYGHIMQLLPSRLHFLTAPFCIIVMLALCLSLYRSRGDLVSATGILNLAATALVIPSCLTIGLHFDSKRLGSDPSGSRRVYQKADPSRASETSPRTLPPPREVSPEEAAKLPDIYYIILDAYGRADSLKHFYGYDNSPFIHALEERGFYVAHHGRSNYAQTAYCLPTALNMNYLPDLLHAQGDIDNRFETLRRLIDENAVAAFLRNRGYHYVYIWTGTAATRGETADLMLADDSTAPSSSLEGQLFRLSAFGDNPDTQKIFSAIAADYDKHRAYLLTAFHNLNAVPELPYPKFVFAHILAPHPPFVFGPNGEPVHPRYPYDEADASQLLQRIPREEYKSGYIAQLQYINKRVLEAVDTITRQSRRPPIIIIQGDHGSRMNLDWESQEKTDLREPFSNLNAYLVPFHVREHLYGTITPVNSFRIILSEVFGANYPPLPDRSFYASPLHPLQFSEVTHQIPAFPEETSIQKAMPQKAPTP